jgi:hypothetical protein
MLQRKNMAAIATLSFITPELQKTIDGKNKNAIAAANAESALSVRIFLASIHEQ